MNSNQIIIKNIFHNYRKEDLLYIILETEILISPIKEVDNTIIDLDNYCMTCDLKTAQVLIISMKNIEY